ncbi:MAG: purine-nucleoside phosphorylase, partial [Candidatus Eremiobacteraeota bacterium]|nr:purine-nucleoside phosphorylase [Candidatus Eremiobacteraeota bacterium]
MIDRRAPNDKLLAHDATLIEEAAGGPVDVAVILGSGLSSALRDRFKHTSIPYDTLLGMPAAALRGHAGEALVGTLQGKRVVAFAGRVHLYQGFSPAQVTVNVRLAAQAGAKLAIITNAAGGINASFTPGDIMLISDQLNLTGKNPLIGWPHENPFLDMADAYSERLRSIAKSVAKPEARLREGVYAGLQGPSFETPAEVDYLRTIGADAVGMSTVLETIFARFIGMGVLGISLVTNAAGAKNTNHTDVTAIGHERGPAIADLIGDFLAKL